ncbi:hypothetical protein D3C86_1885250 [compost metagenome]
MPPMNQESEQGSRCSFRPSRIRRRYNEGIIGFIGVQGLVDLVTQSGCYGNST